MSKRKYVKPVIETVKEVTVIENEVKDESSNVLKQLKKKQWKSLMKKIKLQTKKQ